jgi:hypothetical protein
VNARASEPLASEGATFVLASSGRCAENAVCSPTANSEAQFFLWSPPERSHDTARGLYFDMINLSATAAEPSGTLSFYSVDSSCEGDVPAIVVPLTDLALDGSWRTRCVPLDAPIERLGVAITGSAYDVGFDAVRFGGPCR